MNAFRATQALVVRVWRKLPVVVRAALVALLILQVGQTPPTLLLLVNLRWAPDLPVFVLTTAIWLWLFWRYSRGEWWPRATSEQRRRDLRAPPLSRETWRWSLLAGGLGMAGVMSLALLTGRIAHLPARAYEAPFDLSAYPWWTVACFFVVLAAIAGMGGRPGS